MSFKNHRQYHKNLLAFGLLEVMIAAMILSISLLGIASMQARVVQISIEADRKETAYRAIRQLMHFVNDITQGNLVQLIAIAQVASISNPALDCVSPNSCSEADYYYKSILLGWQKNVVATALPSGASHLCAYDMLNTQSKNPRYITLRATIRWTTLSGSFVYVYADHNVLVDLTNPTPGTSAFPAFKDCPSDTVDQKPDWSKYQYVS